MPFMMWFLELCFWNHFDVVDNSNGCVKLEGITSAWVLVIIGIISIQKGKIARVKVRCQPLTVNLTVMEEGEDTSQGGS